MPVTLIQMLCALKAGDAAGAYDKLLPLKEQSFRDKLREAPEYSGFFDSLNKKCAELEKSALPCMPYSLFRRFDTPDDGDRKNYENLYFNGYCARASAEAAKLLFEEACDKRDPLCDPLCDALWACCDLYSWALPAHMWHRSLCADTPEMTDAEFRPLSSPRDVTREVDLFSSMMAADLAEILYLLRDRLPDIVVKRVRENIIRRVLEPMTEFNRVFFWEVCTNNWASVCAGSVGCAAIYTVKDSELLAPLLTRMCGAMDRYLDGFGADCICDEGVTYWIYGFRHFIAFADLLYVRTAGKINLFDSERVRRIAEFPQKAMLNGSVPASFADCPMNVRFPEYMFSRLSREYPSLPMPSADLFVPVGFDRVFSYMTRALTWRCGSTTGFPTGAETAPNAQWLIIRGRDSAFACKGGHNAESHNHNDVGSFILQLGQRQFCADLGPGEYTAQYFGAGRYQTVNAGSQGHSVPIIDGVYQSVGARFRAKDASFTDNSASFDISSAYALPCLTELRRGLVYSPDGEALLSLSDRFGFFDGLHEVTERIVTVIKPEIRDGAAVISDGKYTLTLRAADGWALSVTGGGFVSQRSDRLYSGEKDGFYFIDYTSKISSAAFTLSFLLS